jgi:5-formyltetrahydrofolate cyclo-ligase
MTASKDHVRELYKLKRSKLPEAARKEMDLQIRDRFFEAIELPGIKVIHTYLPINKRKEVNTFPIIDELRISHPQIRIALPFTRIEDQTLDHYYWDPGEPLKDNRWLIPEPDPASSQMVDIKDIGLIIVPLLAFDIMGRRVGYGAGYYDKFLAGCKENTLIVGLSHFPPEDQWIKFEEYDVDLDVCITPDTTFKF